MTSCKFLGLQGKWLTDFGSAKRLDKWPLVDLVEIHSLMSIQKDYSMATVDVVDVEVKELVDRAYTRATQIITTHIDILHKLAQFLIEKEIVDEEEFMSLFINGKAELYIA
ncbi:ATP-dependent zinc metalloprotease FTSH, chloroplastic [Sesamum alatum]|uniref:ATP-dependent zinc metalloprotease FTSH, chloroplastic n=1 Tax=Sesamum alatum TaxID=300844 RepID=A0AAE1YRH8_9LAMI|nr:ATP-dependent zinc metalloprotease FTSH, chloroplastic [Sesamum alatum]